jgi:hypothetical protein
MGMLLLDCSSAVELPSASADPPDMTKTPPSAAYASSAPVPDTVKAVVEAMGFTLAGEVYPLLSGYLGLLAKWSRTANSRSGSSAALRSGTTP